MKSTGEAELVLGLPTAEHVVITAGLLQLAVLPASAVLPEAGHTPSVAPHAQLIPHCSTIDAKLRCRTSAVVDHLSAALYLHSS